MNVVNVQNLRKSYGTRVVFDEVAFAVDEGEKVGFIGANGSGKSTLFRIVAGLEGAASGDIALKRGATVGYLAQEPGFAPGETVRAAAAAGHPEMEAAMSEYHSLAARLAQGGETDRLLGRQAELMSRIEILGGWDWEHRVETVLTQVGLDRWDRQVDGLSGGERKRTALARVLLQKPDLLLLDEPTNHLDADTTLWLEEQLISYAGAVMLITHDRYFLDRVVTRMIEVSRAELTAFPGGYTEYLEAKAERQARAAVEDEKRARLMARELEWVQRSPSARTGKQKARIQRLEATSADHERNKLPSQDAAAISFGEPPRLGRTVLELHDVSKSFGDHVLIDRLTTGLRAGERIGVVGPNGAGKTTLLRIVLGGEEPDSGSVTLGKNTRIAYFDQRREDLDPGSSVLEALASSEWVEHAGRRVHVRSYLESFLFPTEIHEQAVRSLSGGERNRLLLARLLLEDANLLILDEPTNDLDLVTLQVLESALVEFPGCVLVVTHDRFFLDKVATGLLVFEGGGAVHRHEGGYELYRRMRQPVRDAAREARRREPAGRRGEERRGGEPAPGPRRLSFHEKRELEGMETAIVAAEEERERLAAELSDPALYTDAPERIAELTAAFNAAVERVDRLYGRWSELEAMSSG
jgi:ATP-binding cassette subfamily F protein uup